MQISMRNSPLIGSSKQRSKIWAIAPFALVVSVPSKVRAV
jgi:hypothetical protein